MRLLLVLLIASLTACGFQPRRELVLPANLQALRVETPDPYSALQRGLEQALQRAGARVDGEARSGVLRISRAELNQRPLSIGATGRVQEFELTYAVDAELIDAQGNALLPKQTVELSRDYSFDTAQALGSPGEEELLRSELERDMIAAVLRRVDAALR